VTLAPAGSATSTDAVGNYSFCGLASGSYTVTPSLVSRSFTPASLPVTIALSNPSNRIDNNFVAQ
jgi:hypothetical protein